MSKTLPYTYIVMLESEFTEISLQAESTEIPTAALGILLAE